MSDRDRNTTGEFVETVRLDDVVGVFEAVRGPAITSSDVAEELDCSTEAARQKLSRLYDQGSVDKRKSGRTTLWWFTGGERITPDERTESNAQQARQREQRHEESRAGEQPEETDTHQENPTETAESDDTTDWVPDLRDTLPGSGANLDGRVQAVRDIQEYLKEHGQGKRGDFSEVIDLKATGYQSFKSFWTNCVNNTGVLGTLPGVQTPGEGGHTYTYNPAKDSGIYDPTDEF